MDLRQPEEEVDPQPQLLETRPKHFIHPVITSTQSFIGYGIGFYNDRHIIYETPKIDSRRYSFFHWKNYSLDTYWEVDFLKECRSAKAFALRTINESVEAVTWPQFATVLLNVLHFISYASNNYKADPIAKENYRNLDYRHVLFGELLAAFCPTDALEDYFNNALTGIAFEPESSTYRILTTTNLLVPCTVVHTYYDILVEAIRFLIHAGFITITEARLAPPIEQGAQYSLIFHHQEYAEVVHAFDRDRVNARTISDGNILYCFQVQTKYLRNVAPYHLKKLYLYIKGTVTKTEAENNFRWGSNVPTYFSIKDPYWCPYC